MSEYQTVESHIQRGYDSMPVRGTSPELLDMERVAAHITAMARRGNALEPPDPIEYLFRRRCLVQIDDQTLVTVAGLLCFGHAPQQLFPRAVVDLGHYRGVETVSYEVVHLERDIGGTIFDQLARVETYLWTNTHHGMTLAEGSLQRVQVHEYPAAVIRELIVNMIAHRDYDNHMSAARVQLFRNRIEWISPGGLPIGVTVENILASQASRNPIILAILYDAGYVESFGQGLDTVVAELRREGMSPPRFEDTGSSFIVTVLGRPLELFSNEGIFGQINERQRRILSTIRSRGAATPRDITALFDNTTTPRTLQRDLRELIEANLIIPEGKGRAVRYRLADTLR